MASPDEINKKVESETSFGNYVVKDLTISAMGIGGLVAGGALGYGASRWGWLTKNMKKAGGWLAKRFNPVAGEVIKDWAKKPEIILPAVGAVAGSVAASIPNTYVHWAERRRTELRVEEMATDVIALREQRNDAVKQLGEQAGAIRDTNTAIQKILEKGPVGPDSKAAKDVPEEKTTRLEQRSSGPSAEPQRG